MSGIRSQQKQFGGTKFLVGVASLIILIAGLNAAQGFFIPFLFAMFLAILGTGPVTWLHRRGLPTLPAVLIVTAVMVGIFALVGYFLVNSINDFTNMLPRYREKFNELADASLAWLQSRGLQLTSTDFSGSLEPGAAMDLLGATLKGVVGALSGAVLVLVITVFMMYEAADFRVKLTHALDTSVDMERFGGVTYDVQRYLAIKTVTSLVTGVLAGFWVWLMGVDFPFLWGSTAFLLNYIPFLGSIIAAIPAVMLALIQLDFAGAVTLGLGYVVINVGVSNFLEPVLMGRRLGLSPLVVFLSLIVWGWIWGPAGMLLSVPLTMIIKILLEHSDDFRWIALLMDTKPRRRDSG